MRRFVLLFGVLAFLLVVGTSTATPTACPPDCGVFLPLIKRDPTPLAITAGFEITQGVQQPDTSVQLVANRPTYARVTITSATSHTNVEAYLHASRNGQELATSPIAAINNPRTLKSSANRSALNDTFNFALPNDWLSGTLTLWVTADNGTTYFATSQTTTVSFTSVPTLNVRVVPVQYQCQGGGTITPTAPFDYLIEYTRKVYPVPNITLQTRATPLTYSGPCTNGKPDPTQTDWVYLLYDITDAWLADGAPNEYYYALLDVECSGGCIAGLGWIGGYKAAVGWTGWNANHDGASETHAHEVGHNHGRKHAPGCGAADPDPAYPYTDGNGKSPIGNSGAQNYGFDVYGSQTIYPYTQYYDIMGYCDPTWISDYTYEAILTYAQQNNLLRITHPENVMFVSGMLGENDTSATLRPAFTLETANLPHATGPYTLDLLDAGGRLLASYTFAPVHAALDPVGDAEGGDIRGFALTIPAHPKADAIRIRKGSEVLAERHGGAAAPQFVENALTATTNTLRWAVSDTDGDDLVYLVRYSPDGGKTWQALAINQTATELARTTPLAPGLYEILASDGVHTSRLRTEIP
ncbi:hypothetical protein ARMA_2222 [Ardenticatena maritima]|uniref:Uncharacterized protein n=1 Tax=Ardenticatena maritima TaxID=872965 RepID=A0A0M8KAI9_9CHLR|nr:hypothetical protein [Ardenticatena maritima]KPL89076.1 hypothetical protein SE16_00565 [Ardenticatena maritima]GAP63799.1 hypothetical protein ARMA_2222 [Ardenticatena maritima]